MKPNHPMAEHIRRDTLSDITGLLRKARYPHEGRLAGTHGRDDAAASYREAMSLIEEFRKGATPKQLFALLDLLKDFPHEEFGGEGGAACTAITDSLLEQYRRKVFAVSGWGCE